MFLTRAGGHNENEYGTLGTLCVHRISVVPLTDLGDHGGAENTENLLAAKYSVNIYLTRLRMAHLAMSYGNPNRKRVGDLARIIHEFRFSIRK